MSSNRGRSDWADVEGVEGVVAEGCGRVGVESIDVAEIEVASPVSGQDFGCGDVEGAHLGKGESAEPTLTGEDPGPVWGDGVEATDPKWAAVPDHRLKDTAADVVLHADIERAMVAAEPGGDRFVDPFEGEKQETADMGGEAPGLPDREPLDIFKAKISPSGSKSLCSRVAEFLHAVEME